MYSSSVDMRHYEQQNSENCRTRLKSFLRRLNQHFEHNTDLQAYGTDSLAKGLASNYQSDATLEYDDIAWNRSMSRTPQPSPKARSHRKTRALQSEQAELLDDENSAWVRPPTKHQQNRVPPSSFHA